MRVYDKSYLFSKYQPDHVSYPKELIKKEEKSISK